jgi:hypothetical protein
MSEIPQDTLRINLVNGRNYPFKALPHNEMMLMTDRRAQQFLMRVLVALRDDDADNAAGDFDLTPLNFWQITQDTRLQWQHYSEYERPWEYNIFPALRQSIIDRWEECLAANPQQSEVLTGKQVANTINSVVMRRSNVTKDGLIMLEFVTQGRPEFDSLRDYFSKTVAPYRPTPEYNLVVHGNVWQSIIADCMHRRDTQWLQHILDKWKEQEPEALSDAIAHMVMGISWRLTLPEKFSIEEIATLNACIPYMLFSKGNSGSAIRDVLDSRRIHDPYWMYDLALEQFISHPELQEDSMNFGHDLGNWTISEISSLIEKLVTWGVKTSYIMVKVFMSLANCRQDVWDMLESLLPGDMSAQDKQLWNIVKTWRKTAVLEGLNNQVETDESEITVNMPLGIHNVSQAVHTLTPFPLKIRTKMDTLTPLPDFYYLIPEPTAFATHRDKVPRNKEQNLRTGYRFVALIQAPENHTWMKLPNHTHFGPWTELWLVALTPDNQSRFFTFDCLEDEFRTHLIANFPITNHEKISAE